MSMQDTALQLLQGRSRLLKLLRNVVPLDGGDGDDNDVQIARGSLEWLAADPDAAMVLRYLLTPDQKGPGPSSTLEWVIQAEAWRAGVDKLDAPRQALPFPYPLQVDWWAELARLSPQLCLDLREEHALLIEYQELTPVTQQQHLDLCAWSDPVSATVWPEGSLAGAPHAELLAGLVGPGKELLPHEPGVITNEALPPPLRPHPPSQRFLPPLPWLGTDASAPHDGVVLAGGAAVHMVMPGSASPADYDLFLVVPSKPALMPKSSEQERLQLVSHKLVGQSVSGSTLEHTEQQLRLHSIEPPGVLKEKAQRLTRARHVVHRTLQALHAAKDRLGLPYKLYDYVHWDINAATYFVLKCHSEAVQDWDDNGPCGNVVAFKAQIILRLYETPAQVIHGFDLDACSVLYDGSEVYATRRALRALHTRTLLIDPLRQSPSFERRLVKYAARYGLRLVIPGIHPAIIRAHDADMDALVSDVLQRLSCTGGGMDGRGSFIHKLLWHGGPGLVASGTAWETSELTRRPPTVWEDLPAWLFSLLMLKHHVRPGYYYNQHVHWRRSVDRLKDIVTKHVTGLKQGLALLLASEWAKVEEPGLNVEGNGPDAVATFARRVYSDLIESATVPDQQSAEQLWAALLARIQPMLRGMLRKAAKDAVDGLNTKPNRYAEFSADYSVGRLVLCIRSGHGGSFLSGSHYKRRLDDLTWALRTEDVQKQDVRAFFSGSFTPTPSNSWYQKALKPLQDTYCSVELTDVERIRRLDRLELHLERAEARQAQGEQAQGQGQGAANIKPWLRGGPHPLAGWRAFVAGALSAAGVAGVALLVGRLLQQQRCSVRHG